MEVTDIKHFGIGRKIISNMTVESWTTIPHVCITYEADVTSFMNILNEINEGKNKEEKITVNTVMLKVISEGLKAAPSLNGHIHFKRRLVRGVVTTYKNIDVSMPVILKNKSMMTLNIHGIEKKSLCEIRDEVADSIRRADNTNLDEVMYEVSMADTLKALKKGHLLKTLFRLIGSKIGKHKIHHLKGNEKKKYYSIPETERLTKHDLEQGTITISNMGSLKRNWNGVCTVLEIVPPQLTAIALGAVTQKPICKKDGSIAPGLVLPITIAFDHRALDTSDVIPFMDKLDEVFGNPEILKEWL